MNFTTSGEFEIVRKIKEKRCLLSISAYSNEKILEERKVKDPYILPDGNVIELSYEKTRAPEILFNPDRVGFEGPGVH
jgi:centractin